MNYFISTSSDLTQLIAMQLLATTHGWESSSWLRQLHFMTSFLSPLCKRYPPPLLSTPFPLGSWRCPFLVLILPSHSFLLPFLDSLPSVKLHVPFWLILCASKTEGMKPVVKQNNWLMLSPQNSLTHAASTTILLGPVLWLQFLIYTSSPLASLEFPIFSYIFSVFSTYSSNCVKI